MAKEDLQSYGLKDGPKQDAQNAAVKATDSKERRGFVAGAEYFKQRHGGSS